MLRTIDIIITSALFRSLDLFCIRNKAEPFSWIFLINLIDGFLRCKSIPFKR